MRQIALILILLIASQSAIADVYTYECSIKNEVRTNDDGELVLEHQIYIGGTFHIDRKTGIVLGGGVSNSSYKKREVIDPGGEEQSFKLIWHSHPVKGTDGGINSVYLVVYEYNENYLKPFVLVAGNAVLSGVCK